MSLSDSSMAIRSWLSLGVVFATGVLLLFFTAWLGSKDFAVTYRWHSVPFHLGLFCLLYVFIAIPCTWLGVTRSKSILLLVSSASCLVLIEVAIRGIGSESTYLENRSGWYQSSYQKNLENPLRVHLYYSEFWMETPEYRFHRTVNGHGFTDREFVPKKSGEMLIQTYGDSFTEGDGAAADSSYPALLRNMFSEKKLGHVRVQNFGKSGNDPGFYWKQLKDVGVDMNPDIVVITYSSLDYTTDFFTRGGLERFHDGRWSALEGPPWEFVYANSHLTRWLARMLFDIERDDFLATPSQRESRLVDLKPEWNAVFDSILTFSQREGFDVMLIKKPERSEIANRVYEFDFEFFDDFLADREGFAHFDLMEFYLNERQFTADSTARYYWVYDGHHNGTGYELMAEGVFKALLQSFPDKFLIERVNQ